MSIGETLTNARVAAGLTTQDVADRTRIRRTLVEAIEADDYHLCGGDVYARGHIGTIARTVGLDPAPLLAEFDSTHRGDSLPRAREVFEAENVGTRERTGPNWTAVMVAALVVVIALTGWQLLRGGGAPAAPTALVGSSASTSAPGPSTAGPSPSVTHSPTASSSSPHSSDVAQVPPRSGVTVKVAAVTGNCWIQATAGSKVVYEGTLQQGGSKVFTDSKQVKLILGNSGAVRLTVNGHNLGSPAGSGQISRLTFGPGDPTAGG
ncbi:MAG TPA: RodZ domain-containing protein [Actinomycetes bacterium]|nr:RodZ domain-containing protein [Actinomycetes bacterium]